MSDQPTVLFAGGGSGGHLFPVLAIAERLARLDSAVCMHFACSARPIDAKILGEAGADFTPLHMEGLPRQPWKWGGFLGRYMAAKRVSKRLIDAEQVRCVVATGGFISGPVVGAARARRVATVLVNLDAVPGKANRYLAGKCQRVFSAYRVGGLGVDVEPIAVPLPDRSIGATSASEARLTLGLAPDRPLLLVVGGSQGAQTVNRMMSELLLRDEFAAALDSWQVMHLSGAADTEALRADYAARSVVAAVLPFCDRMGLAWAAAELAISRAGANSVAEVVANRAPTLFMPCPFHADLHQKYNAQPLVDVGAAHLINDTKDAQSNANSVLPLLLKLMGDEDARQAMRQRLAELDQGNGADTIAAAVVQILRG
jgi:UDP-N-acetylglucosamine--N-acetylmuramyl-(pentapeptide) pyrophosphoryl-undecaprenol N-acetylglucosamine transferase